MTAAIFVIEIEEVFEARMQSRIGDRVELFKKLFFDLEVFRRGFDDQQTIFQIFETRSSF